MTPQMGHYLPGGRSVNIMPPPQVTAAAPTSFMAIPALAPRLPYWDGPSEMDIARTHALEKFLGDAEMISTEEAVKRRNVLSQLEQIVKRWVKKVAWQRRISEDLKERSNAKIFPFGSYHLEVHGPEADIDALCVGPCYASLEDDFFIVLCNMLKKTHGVSEVQCVKNANVPLMRFKFNGISIDLVYARLAMKSIPEDINILDERLMDNLDDTSMKSLRGRIGTARILQLVPNRETFRSTLRCIKFWAKRRGVYSHTFGFLGGIHYAVLVAHVCQMFPQCSVSMLVSRFFGIYAYWPWPNPVTLVNVRRERSDIDRHHQMPIIVPVHPYACCSYNVTRSTFSKLKSEFLRGWVTTRSIETNWGSLPKSVDWDCLFEPFPFLSSYEYFVQICLTASDVNDLRSWRGWAESRFRHLLLKFEKLAAYCDPSPTPYFDENVREPHCYFFWGLIFKRNLCVDMAALEEEFRMYLSNGYEGRPGCDVYLTLLNRFQLPRFASKLLEHRQHSQPYWTNENYNQYHGAPVYLQYVPHYFLNYAAPNHTAS